MASVTRLAGATGPAASFRLAKRMRGSHVSRSCSYRVCQSSPVVSPATACRASPWRGFATSERWRQAEPGGRPEFSGSVNGKSEPLRILYCGSDDFSKTPLEALWNEHCLNPKVIEKIQVLVRPGKPTGRGYKTIREPPLKEHAVKLGLDVIERDTFTGWEMPPDINLIIAVSFGKKVPKRLLTQAQYGGLNLHPSMLPDLRGPAPLHHALMLRRETTGVTLQTLHPEEFDRGDIVAQTPVNDQWRIPRDATVPELVEPLSGIAAQMLVDSLRRGLHTGRVDDAEGPPGWLDQVDVAARPPLAIAPKITAEDRRLVPLHATFPALDVDDVAVRQRVIGPLWFETKAGLQRVIVDQAAPAPAPPFLASDTDRGPESLDDLAATATEQPDDVWPPRRVRFYRCASVARVKGDDEPGRDYDVWFFVPEGGRDLYLMETPKEAAPGVRLVAGLGIQSLKLAGHPSTPAMTAFRQLAVSDEGCKDTQADYSESFERRLVPMGPAVSPVRPKYEYVPIRANAF